MRIDNSDVCFRMHWLSPGVTLQQPRGRGLHQSAPGPLCHGGGILGVTQEPDTSPHELLRRVGQEQFFAMGNVSRSGEKTLRKMPSSVLAWHTILLIGPRVALFSMRFALFSLDRPTFAPSDNLRTSRWFPVGAVRFSV